VTGSTLDIVVLGLSITSSWGNGHAVTYRALVRALAERGHRVLFLERDVAWYACQRDLPAPTYCEVGLYADLDDLRDRFGERVRHADVVMQGSFVPDGCAVADWVLASARGTKAFYDIDTPVTLVALESDTCAYLARRQVSRFDLYLSFTGGPTLLRLERELGARRARPLYCSCDPSAYFPEERSPRWDLGYMGTYSVDRQGPLEALLFRPAVFAPKRRFAVAGSLYPPELAWPRNVARIEHLPPADHRAFYGAQRFTLNLTRADMRAAGHSPSVRLFEAAACGVPILSDEWAGLEELFRPGEEILIVRSSGDVVRALERLSPDEARRIGRRASLRVRAEHSGAQRAELLERYLAQVWAGRAAGAGRRGASGPSLSRASAR
jgi:spore maturation protein CgeB